MIVLNAYKANQNYLNKKSCYCKTTIDMKYIMKYGPPLKKTNA